MTRLKNNTHRKLFIFCFFMLGYSVQAQIHIRGQVVDSTTNSPILGVSVYFDGTTIGTVTDKKGNFDLRLKEKISSPLVIGVLGYKSKKLGALGLEKNNVDLKTIALGPKVESLKEVVLEPDTWSRERKLKYFIPGFLGKIHEGCFIKNINKVYLRFSKKEKKLTAYAKEPLQIENKALGFKIRFSLSNFEMNFKFYPAVNGRPKPKFTPYSIFFTGTTFFEEISDDPSKYKAVRKRAYLGSSVHFMRALKNKTLEENDFAIFRKSFIRGPYKFFGFKDTKDSTQTKIEITTDELSILYDGEKQTGLKTITDPCVILIDQFGNHYPPNALMFTGDMGERRAASLLPLDYRLAEED